MLDNECPSTAAELINNHVVQHSDTSKAVGSQHRQTCTAVFAIAPGSIQWIVLVQLFLRLPIWSSWDFIRSRLARCDQQQQGLLHNSSTILPAEQISAWLAMVEPEGAKLRWDANTQTPSKPVLALCVCFAA